MRRTLLAVASVAWLGLCAGPAGAQSPREFLYTTNYGDDNISGFRMDALTGHLTPLPGSPFPGTLNVEDLAIDPTNRFLYTTSVKGTIAGYRIDPDTGALSPVPGSPYPMGLDGLNILVDPSGRFVYATDQVLGAVIGLSIDPVTGALSPLPGSPFDAGFMATGLVVEPGGRFLYAAAGGFSHEVRGFQVDPATGVLTSLPGAPPPIGGNAWGMATDPSGRHLYGASMNDEAVFAYTIDASTGALAPLPAPFPAPAGDAPRAAVLERSGRFLYVATTGTGGGISLYEREPLSGTLDHVAHVPATPWPDDLVVDPSNRFLYATWRSSDLVARYVIDAATGGLTLTGLYETAFAPSGIAMTSYQSQQAPALWVTDVSVDEEAGPATFSVVLLPASSQAVTVSYATVPGTAQAGADYAPVNGTLTFAAGTTAATVTVPIVNDTRDEDDETFSLHLTGASVAVADADGVATISDDDPFPVLNGGAVTVIEGETSMTFTVVVFPPSGKTVQVSYVTMDGTATAGSDYVPVSGTLTIPPGASSGSMATASFADRIQEGNETFTMTLSAPVNATVNTHGRGTITDNDPPGLSIADLAVRERPSSAAAAEFTVTLAPTPGDVVTVNWSTQDGTATAGSDYAAASGVLTFDPGVATQRVTVAVSADALVEGVETFTVGLSGAVGAPIAYATGTARVLDPPGGADFDADSRTDLLWRHATSGQNALWYMNGATLVSGTFTTPAILPDVRWTVVGTGEFNADGRPDILWRHATSGEDVVWYMNGSVLTGGTFVGPPPSRTCGGKSRGPATSTSTGTRTSCGGTPPPARWWCGS